MYEEREEAATNEENVLIHGHIIIIETNCSGVVCLCVVRTSAKLIQRI